MAVIDKKAIKEWTSPMELSMVDTSDTIVIEGKDWSGTWTGKFREEGPTGDAIAITLTVTAAYSGGNTTITFSYDGDDVQTAAGTGRELRCWMGMSRADSPIKGCQGPVIFRQVVNR